MTEEERQLIQEIHGSRGWKLVEHIIERKWKEIDTVQDLDVRSIDKAGVEALARKKSVLFLKEFLAEIGFSKSLKDTNQTYE